MAGLMLIARHAQADRHCRGLARAIGFAAAMRQYPAIGWGTFFRNDRHG
ncbi:hypothetical protein [Sphingobium sp. 15-1]|nr:hypothetical protein [Sphingobium sp. 15-1]